MQNGGSPDSNKQRQESPAAVAVESDGVQNSRTQPRQNHPHYQQQRWRPPHQQPWMAMHQYPAAPVVMQQSAAGALPRHHFGMQFIGCHLLQHGHNQQQGMGAGQRQRVSRQNKGSDDGESNTTIWVGDLHPWMDENYLHGCFASDGEALTRAREVRSKVVSTTAPVRDADDDQIES